ncbi:MAG TPA: hypothetical protein VFQ61_27125 [Polyangiaceae bacterium]|nr:hypothetical protein [Polyangiaceae bacterium]
MIERQFNGRGTTERMLGAQVFVPAQPGLTAEWLRSRVEQHVSGMRHTGMAGCPLGVSNLRVALVSGGTGCAKKNSGEGARGGGLYRIWILNRRC